MQKLKTLFSIVLGLASVEASATTRTERDAQYTDRPKHQDPYGGQLGPHPDAITRQDSFRVGANYSASSDGAEPWGDEDPLVGTKQVLSQSSSFQSLDGEVAPYDDAAPNVFPPAMAPPAQEMSRPAVPSLNLKSMSGYGGVSVAPESGVKPEGFVKQSGAVVQKDDGSENFPEPPLLRRGQAEDFWNSSTRGSRAQVAR